MSNYDAKYPEGTFKICPKFIEYNTRSCKDLSTRYSKHNTHRSRCIQRCFNETINELCNLPKLFIKTVPYFEERHDILLSSINAMNEQINKTSTVQAHKCKTPITTYQQFSKKANNRQDQNSWKVSGQYFFVPYINVFIKFIKQIFIPIIGNNSNINNQEFIKLSGIIFALKLLTCKVKFERAKEKPLIRDRTLVLSGPLHIAFKKLHPLLNVPKFYLIEKAKRKKLKKKIVSADFHSSIGEFCQYLLEIQRKSILNPNFNNNDGGIAKNYCFPQDWIKDDDDDDDMNETKIDEDDENEYEDEQDENTGDDYDNNGKYDVEMNINTNENEYDDGDTLNTGHSGSVTYGDTDTIDTDLPPIIQPPTQNDYNNNNNTNNHFNCMIIMDPEDEDDNNTQYSSSTQNSNNSNNSNGNNNNNCANMDIPFNQIHTYHSNNSNNNSVGEYSRYGGGNNDNYNTIRLFQPMSNFANSNIGINKGGLTTDSIKRNYRNNRESHIEQMRNNRFICNNQYQQPTLKSKTRASFYRQQQQRVEAHFPTPSFSSNNNKNFKSFTPSTTPSTSTISIPRYKRNDNSNNNISISNNNNNDNDDNDNSTCNQSIINPLFIFNSTDINMNDDSNDINIGLGGFKLAVPSPEQICKVGSDTIMTGAIHSSEMGYSYNN